MRARCGGGAAAWVAGVLAAPGTQGSWQLGQQEIQCSRGYGNQYWPIYSSILAWRTPSQTEKPGRPPSTGSQRVGHNRSDPARIGARLFFACGNSAPRTVECEGRLALQGPWWPQVCRDMDCLRRRSYGPIRGVFTASCSWCSEGLVGQSFSEALPIQAPGKLPCLGSSVVLLIRTIKGLPPGVLLCRSASQALRRAPWVGSYSVVQ